MSRILQRLRRRAAVPAFGAVVMLCVACGAADDTLAPGRFEGNTFIHDGFGLRVTFPDGWALPDEEEMARINEAGKQVLSEGDPSGATYESAGAATSRPLVTAYRYPLGSVQGLNPNINIAVENVLARPEIQTPTDYLEMLQDFLTRGGVPVTFQDIARDKDLGGQDFDVLGATIHAGGGRIGQLYYCRRIEPYMLTVVASFANATQWAEIESVLQNGVTVER